ncbi:ribbon-helix-helix domain-containing protein [Catenovulum sp. SM1970]|uniref:ribbon-helix-helix domain-containing protein n=1 Tax=Marinifaba aquimaris TaxID=2741323 RepID=UPI00157461C0|nr:ribbon-helix-helix domain-containing protein [Marinifaba aquimaris]NTS75414.1 ribbon-helix-helix domain-containing protein [Marinifaba aquimaris]
MGFADLKSAGKPSAKTRVLDRELTLEEFIDGAALHAKGLKQEVAIKPKQLSAKEKRFTPATFTLNNEVKADLTELSEALGVSKSKLVRIMTRHLVSMGEIEQQLVMKLYQDDEQ